VDANSRDNVSGRLFLSFSFVFFKFLVSEAAIYANKDVGLYIVGLYTL